MDCTAQLAECQGVCVMHTLINQLIYNYDEHNIIWMSVILSTNVMFITRAPTEPQKFSPGE